MLDFKKDVKFIKGVGPNKVKLLNKLGIFTLYDLITYYPRTYEDRGNPKTIAHIKDGEECLIEAVAVNKLNHRIIRNNMSVQNLVVRDETGTCMITWFNRPYLKGKFEHGQIYKFYGKVTIKSGKIEMSNPVYDSEISNNNTGKIIPIYPLTYQLSQNAIRKIIENALKEVKGQLEENIPEYILEEFGLMGLEDANFKIHFPSDFDEFQKARYRLVFEELFILQLALLRLKKENTEEKKGIRYNKDVKMSDVISTLPYKLTNAQNRVLEEIDNDMEQDKPMNRLLQGDVGSGKTVISMISAYKAIKSGYQVAILAPTTILARQHLENFNKILGKFDINCELLVSGITKKKKEEILEKVKNGEVDVLIGTHALIEDNVIFERLGLVVTDEQHRFGVKQRSKIIAKGENPDVLVMTATPIPRTLALILYGDLDISVIDELPPNRKKIDTFAVPKSYEDRVDGFIVKQMQEGRQVYVVCPLVEESEELDLKAVTEVVEKYKQIFHEYKVEYIHGKMKPKEKEDIMSRFKSHEIDLLISTTVIEVGVDVPNANLMVIENAERFGLAALHQLRGRVGRGEYKSYCILKYNGKSELVKKRMEIMQSTQDGFIIAGKDLELRGSGEFFGTRQHGIPEFKIANLFEDMPTLQGVQALALRIENEDPSLEMEKNKQLHKLVDQKFIQKTDVVI